MPASTAPGFSDVVQPIPQGSASGEIAVVPSTEVFYTPPPAACLVDLLERHAAAHSAAKHAESELAAALERYRSVRPDQPETTYLRIGDPISKTDSSIVCRDGKRRAVYDDAAIKELMEWEPCCFSSGSADSPEGPGMAWRPDLRGRARKAGILASYASWKAELGRLADHVGWTAANAECVRTCDEAQNLLCEVLDFQPPNLSDVAKKARWLEALGVLTEWSVVIAWDVIALDGSVAQGRFAEAAFVKRVA